MLKRILIVEGYMDAISLYQRGITNVVASLGTALTDAHGRLLRKNAEQVILGQDTDSAGQAAVLRSIEILNNMNIDLRVLQLEGAKDPDEFVLKYGATKFMKYMDDAISGVEFEVKVLKSGLNLDNVSDKIKFLNQTAKILSRVSNEIERELYINKISKKYEISKQALIAEIEKNLKGVSTSNNKILESDKVSVVKTKEIKEEKLDKATIRREELIIYLLGNYKNESFDRIKKVVDIDLIKSELNKVIIAKIYESEKDQTDIVSMFDDQDLINKITGILAKDFEIRDNEQVEKAIIDIENYYVKEKNTRRRDEILKELSENKDLTDDEKIKLSGELNKIILSLSNKK